MCIDWDEITGSDILFKIGQIDDRACLRILTHHDTFLLCNCIRYIGTSGTTVITGY